MIEQQDNRQFDDEELMDITRALIMESQEYQDEKLGPDREQAMDRYLRMPHGDEIDGRSQVTTSDVSDTIEWVLPSLLRVFISGEDIVDIQPREESDVMDAKIAKEWVNFVLMSENDGFTMLHNCLKNALLLKTGPVQCNWKTEVKSGPENYVGASEQEVMNHIQDPEYALRELIPRTVQTMQPALNPATMQPMMMPAEVTVYDIKGTRKTKSTKLNVEAFNPEEFLTTPDTTSVPDGGNFFAIRRHITLGEIRSLGYEIEDDTASGKLVSGYTSDGASSRDSTDRSGSYTEVNYQSAASTTDASLKKVWCYWCYVRIDQDGDGIPEWWLIVRTEDVFLGADHVHNPYLYTWSPVMIPGKWCGLSLADLVVDLQKLHTVLNRSILDYIYLVVNPRHEIAENMSNEHTLLDYQDPAMGGAIRTRVPGAVTPLVNAPLPAEAFNYIETIHMQRENRTGVTRYNQGIHADTLNKTASGIMSIMQAAQARVEMIARIFAETGFKKIVNGIISLTASHPEIAQEQMFRLNGKMVKLDPSKLRGKYDLVVNVGLGTGNKEQMLVHLNTLWEKQLQLLGIAGPDAQVPMVDLQNLFNTVKEMARNMGYRSSASFMRDPEQAQPNPQWQPPPNPELIKLDIEKQKLELEGKKAQLDHDYKMAMIDAKNLQVGAHIARDADIAHESTRSRETAKERGD